MSQGGKFTKIKIKNPCLMLNQCAIFYFVYIVFPAWSLKYCGCRQILQKNFHRFPCVPSSFLFHPYLRRIQVDNSFHPIFI